MKIAIVYWSGTGNTESMADIINKKCKELGAETTMFFGAEFDASDLPNYDAVAFGCPASGDESLEESEFQPMWDAVKPKLAGKKIALFGSFSWNEGKWMETWEKDAKTTGAKYRPCSRYCRGAPQRCLQEGAGRAGGRPDEVICHIQTE